MVTLNLKLTDEQVIELVRQLPSERKSWVLAALRDESAVRKARAGNLRRLFRETQSLPQARRITEDEIAAEVAAYRSARP